jgi:hypothetical protein
VIGLPDGELPPGELFATVDESNTERRAALELLGFEAHRRELVLVLPARVERVVSPAGLRARRADEVREIELRLLDDELRQDVPGTDGWRWLPRDFREETYESPQFDPAAYLVAEKERELVGICRV